MLSMLHVATYFKPFRNLPASIRKIDPITSVSIENLVDAAFKTLQTISHSTFAPFLSFLTYIRINSHEYLVKSFQPFQTHLRNSKSFSGEFKGKKFFRFYLKSQKINKSVWQKQKFHESFISALRIEFLE